MGGVMIIGGAVEAWHLSRAMPDALVYLPVPDRLARDWPHQSVRRWPTVADCSDARLIVLACHPCDGPTARATHRLAAAANRPVLHLRRPIWRPQRGDMWRAVRSVTEARAYLPRGGRVLVTLGHEERCRLRNVPAHLLWRNLSGQSEKVDHGPERVLWSKGPFSVSSEMRVLRKERIDGLLLRNAGGTGGWPKLGAARHLGLSVIMVSRAPWPIAPVVRNVEEAVAWIQTSGV